MNLNQRFYKLLFNYTDDTTLVTSLWNDIYIKYTEKHRTYHNLQHLKELFINFDIFKDKLNKPDIIAFSIFYHDIIYNVWSKKNEEKSADFAVDKLSGIINDSNIKEIYNQIIATKTHIADSIDTKWLVDFDLIILGQSTETYTNYSNLIREEYKTVPNFIYKKGRKKVLQHFIKKPFIFATEEVRQLYEKKSKENLSNELKSL